jgi:hypothetical protein
LIPLSGAAVRLRREIKARFGLTRQQVSVLPRSDARGEVLFVGVRVPGVSLRRLNRVAEPYRRDGWRRVEVLLETSVLIPHDAEILRRLVALPVNGPDTFHPLRFGRYVFLVSVAEGLFQNQFRLRGFDAPPYSWNALQFARKLGLILVQSRHWHRLLAPTTSKESRS